MEVGIEGALAAFTAGAARSTEAAALASLFLRSSPRATRNVLFDCSTLTGLLNTRLAPIRNALATPACPSTTATESEL